MYIFRNTLTATGADNTELASEATASASLMDIELGKLVQNTAEQFGRQ